MFLNILKQYDDFLLYLQMIILLLTDQRIKFQRFVGLNMKDLRMQPSMETETLTSLKDLALALITTFSLGGGGRS